MNIEELEKEHANAQKNFLAADSAFDTALTAINYDMVAASDAASKARSQFDADIALSQLNLDTAVHERNEARTKMFHTGAELDSAREMEQ